MTGTDLTTRQRKIIQAIEDSVQRRGYPPTVREIAEAAGLASTSSVPTRCPCWRGRGT